MTTKEVYQDIIDSMKHWQQIEDRSVESTAEAMKKTSNPLLALVMEIINRDSQMHRRVQQLVIDSLEKGGLSLTPDEMGDISAMIDNHINIENEMVSLVEKALGAVKDRKMMVQEYLLNFLVQDERKHASMLSALDKVKRGMYPYA